MTPRKAKRVDQIPISISTEEAVASWSAAVDSALATIGGRFSIGRRFPRWSLLRIEPSRPPIAENMVLLASGEPEQFEFQSQNIEDFVYWLEDADWLDPFPLLPPLDLNHQRQLRELLDTVGDLGELDLFRKGLPPGVLLLPSTLLALATLRWCWRLARALMRGNLPELGAVWAARRQSGITTLAAPADSDPDLVASVHDWLLRNLLVFGFIRQPDVVRGPEKPFVPLNAPTTPLQMAMLAIAAGAGVADAPIMALRVCDYRPCSRIYVADRSGARGSYRFCTRRCGQRFHAMKNTSAKRAAQRAARAQRQQEV